MCPAGWLKDYWTAHCANTVADARLSCAEMTNTKCSLQEKGHNIVTGLIYKSFL